MHQAEPEGLQRAVRQRLVGAGDARQVALRFLHRRHDHVAAAARGKFLAEKVPPPVEVAGADAVGGDRLPTRRLLVEHRDVEIAVHGVGDRPRDRRGGHHQGVRLGLALLEDRPLEHAEAVLLVDDDESQALESRRSADQRLRADDDRRLAGCDPPEHRFPLPRRLATHEHLHLGAGAGEQPLQRRHVLPGQQLRGRHDRRLVPQRPAFLEHHGPRGPRGGHRRGGRGEHGIDRDGRLATAHIALEQPVHRLRPSQVGRDLAAHPPLGRREREGKAGPNAGVEPGIDRQRRCGVSYLLVAAMHPQGELEHEQLLVDEPPPGGVDHLPARRHVDLAERPLDRQQFLRGQHGRRERLGHDAGDMAERGQHRHPHVRLLHALRQGIDGEPVGCVGLLGLTEPPDVGVRKLPAARLVPGLAGDHHPHPLRKPLRHERHPEPHGPHAPVSGGDADREHVPPGEQRLGADIHHFTGDRRVLPGSQVGNRMGTGEVAVLPGKVHHGIADRDEPEPGEPLGPRRPHAHEPLQRRPQARLAIGRRCGHGKRV